MISSLLLLGLITGIKSYSFEIARGPFIEAKAESQIIDKQEKTTYGTGVRIGYSLANAKDLFFSGEIDFSYHRYQFEKTYRSTEEKGSKYSIANLISLYETYSPMAFRIGAGVGMENRDSRYSPLAEYRIGIGYYFNPKWAVYGDGTGQYIFRSDDNIFGMTLGLSLQYIL